jgi:squamous cell carcinoma antigen recognized by T-cells 3
MFIPRNATSRPRAGLGRARNPPPASAAAAAGTSEDKAPVQGKAQDDFRKMLLGGK